MLKRLFFLDGGKIELYSCGIICVERAIYKILNCLYIDLKRLEGMV